MDNDIEVVLAAQQELLISEIALAKSARARTELGNARLSSLGATPSHQEPSVARTQRTPQVREWAQIVIDAQETSASSHESGGVNLDPSQLVILKAWNRDFNALNRVDGFDLGIAGIAGLLGAAIDFFLVGRPKHGRIGGFQETGGFLSNWSTKLIGDLISPGTRRRFAKTSVPYDAEHNSRLDEPVDGLHPISHRLQSPSHDVLLFLITAPFEIMTGKFVAIGMDGRVTIQEGTCSGLRDSRQLMYRKWLKAIRMATEHLISDLPTSAGLPPPGMCLALLLKGSLRNEKGQPVTVARLVRAMYKSGYDLRHFVACSASVAATELIARAAFYLRTLQGAESREAGEDSFRLPTILLMAHAVAAAGNVGKMLSNRSRLEQMLAFNYPEWATLVSRVLGSAAWLVSRPRDKYHRSRMDREWQELDTEFLATWQAACDSLVRVKAGTIHSA